MNSITPEAAPSNLPTGSAISGTKDRTGDLSLPIVGGQGVPPPFQSHPSKVLYTTLSVIISLLVVPAILGGMYFLYATYLQPLADARADIRTLDERVDNHDQKIEELEKAKTSKK